MLATAFLSGPALQQLSCFDFIYTLLLIVAVCWNKIHTYIHACTYCWEVQTLESVTAVRLVWHVLCGDNNLWKRRDLSLEWSVKEYEWCTVSVVMMGEMNQRVLNEKSVKGCDIYIKIKGENSNCENADVLRRHSAIKLLHWPVFKNWLN